MDRNKLLNIARAIQSFTEHKKYNLIDSIFPDEGPFARELYHKHIDFFNAGATHRFRVLGGGNGSGKSFSGAAELTYHMTGEYPEWWKESGFGTKLQDLNILFEIMSKCNEFENVREAKVNEAKDEQARPS